MNIFNKVIMVLFLVSIVFASFLAIINEFVEYFKWSEIGLRLLSPLNDVNPYILTLALLLVIAVSIFILVLEFYRQRPRVANISTSKSGNAMMTLETVAAQIKASSIKIDGLENLKIKIIPKTNGIIINMRVKLVEGSDLPEKMQEIINDASKLVSEKLGIKVLRTNLTVAGLTSGKTEGPEKPEKEVEDKGLPEFGKEVPEPVEKDLQDDEEE